MLRHTNAKDIDSVLEIYKMASESLKNDGVDQWQNEGPNKSTLIMDMEMEYSYVLEENGEIKGTAAIIFDGEKTYDLIFNGNWLNEEEYCTIHRFAVNVNYRQEGNAGKMLKEIEKICLSKGVYNIRIDTHEDNFKMRNFLEKNGFLECGRIFLRNGDLRVAYQKVL